MRRMTFKSDIVRTATLVVAASNATLLERTYADYVCDGVNDEVQIQAAIDALPSAGGTVVLSEGTFHIDNKNGITLSSNLCLRMTPMTTLVLSNMGDNTAYMLRGDSKTNITIYSGILDGNKYNQTATTAGLIQYGISLTDCSNVFIDSVHIKNIGMPVVSLSGYGIYLNNTPDTRIYHCYITGCARESISCYNGSDGTLIMGVVSKDSDDRSFVAHDSDGVSITNCSSDNTSGSGIHLYGASRCRVTGCLIENAGDHGIEIINSTSSPENNIISSNTIYNCAGRAIYLSSTASYNNISNNNIFSNKSGITCNGSRNLIANNYCMNNGGYG